jgi:hypothetical protein
VIFDEFSAGQVANPGWIKLRVSLSRLPGKNMGGALRHGAGKRILDFSIRRAIVCVPGGNGVRRPALWNKLGGAGVHSGKAGWMPGFSFMGEISEAIAAALAG